MSEKWYKEGILQDDAKRRNCLNGQKMQRMALIPNEVLLFLHELQVSPENGVTRKSCLMSNRSTVGELWIFRTAQFANLIAGKCCRQLLFAEVTKKYVSAREKMVALSFYTCVHFDRCFATEEKGKRKFERERERKRYAVEREKLKAMTNPKQHAIL